MKKCVVCGKEAHSPKARYCNDCLTGSKPASVEYAVLKAVREGRLKPIKECICVDCGAKAQHYDHRDYNKPDDVEPVCARCNANRPPAIRYGKNADGDLLPGYKQATYPAPTKGNICVNAVPRRSLNPMNVSTP